MADIHVRTGALREFAGASEVDIDVESIVQLPVEAGKGRSHALMTEGLAFHKVHSQAATLVVRQFEAIRQGNYGYRTGANQIGDKYVTTEHDVVRTQQAVDPFAAASNEQTLQA